MKNLYSTNNISAFHLFLTVTSFNINTRTRRDIHHSGYFQNVLYQNSTQDGSDYTELGTQNFDDPKRNISNKPEKVQKQQKDYKSNSEINTLIESTTEDVETEPFLKWKNCSRNL
jgi:hypothetical protein